MGEIQVNQPGSVTESHTPTNTQGKAEKKIPVVELFGPTIEGEGKLIGTQTHFIRFGLCDYKCRKCIEGSQRVLMADWTYKRIDQIQIGDSVMGMYTSDKSKMHRVIKAAKVSAVAYQGQKETIRVQTPNGSLQCTPDHKLLNVKWRNYWQPADTCQNAVLCTLPIQEPTGNFWLGWLHGLFAGDGSIHKFKDRWWRMKVSMQASDAEAIDKAYSELKALGLDAHLIQHDGGDGATKLYGVEVTNTTQVEAFRDLYLEGLPEDLDYVRGWISGFHDTDGHYDSHTSSVRISQALHCNEWKIMRLRQYLELLGITYNVQEYVNKCGNLMQCVVTSRVAEFFAQCSPVLVRKRAAHFSMRQYPDLPVVNIRDVEGLSDVWDITTESGSFIAEGILVHNCDSMHAVDPSMVKALAAFRTQEEIFVALKEHTEKHSSQHVKNVTFSGGNPAIHDLTELCQMLKADGWRIFVETQGTKHPDWFQYVDEVVCSPKSPGMGEAFELNVFEEFVQFVGQLSLSFPVELSIKIVVFSAQDLEFAVGVAQVARRAWGWGIDDYDGVASDAWIENNFFLSLGNPYPPQFGLTVNEETSKLAVVQDFDYPELGVENNNDQTNKNTLASTLLNHYNQLCEEIMKDPRLGFAKFLPQLHVLVYGNEAGK